MKKTLITLLLTMVSITSAFAQFEAGKKYIGTAFDGAGLAYSEDTKLQLGVSGNIGYMFQQDWLAIAEAGFRYTDSDLQELSFGAKCRYYIEQNGLYLQAGAKFTHRSEGYNNLCLSPEVGYCFFLNSNLTVEPAVYYDMSLSNFSDKSRFGLKVGLGWYF